MFLNAVILVLQEILEASLLLSLFLLLTALQREPLALGARWRAAWVPLSIVLGVLGSWGFAALTPVVSAWFDYVGQEVVNAAFQIVTIALLLTLGYAWRGAGEASFLARGGGMICLIVIVTLAITREGSEIILYTQGIMGQREVLTSVLSGATVAIGIGVSCGVLLYYILRNLNDRRALRVVALLLAFFSGNMAMQAVLLLNQADWLPYTAELWDSSALLPENTVLGQLLYALIGYEATPSLAQLLAYALACAAFMLTPLFRRAWARGEIQGE
ncbi:MAG: hypothetical protein LBE21_06535 [Pseudomonadales bacterium]|jgi:high-affinity iron transporter|nr:hypothetical protein [Pseudomonadales bacterium]